MLDRKIIQTSNPYKRYDSEVKPTRTVFYGEVVSIDDDTDGGRIRVKIDGLDNQLFGENLPWCYPLVPKFFHIYPKVGEVVRVFIEDTKYPQRGRFWIGPIISQPHKVWYETIYTSLSTTNMGKISPEKAPSTYPEADGVYPTKDDVALIGRKNNDIVLKTNETYVRTGKHQNNDVLKLNIKNPAIFSQHFEEVDSVFFSRTIISSDKIAIISHTGQPKFKTSNLTKEDRNRIFETSHPLTRGDVLVMILEQMRKAIIQHIHGYSSLPADKNSIIKDLESINLESILQKNIVIN